MIQKKPQYKLFLEKSMKTSFSDRLGQLLKEYCYFMRKASKTLYEDILGLRTICAKMHNSQLLDKSQATEEMDKDKPG
jgi:hypothetical protein